MTRADFFKVLCGLFTLSAIPSETASKPRKIGFMDVVGHHAHRRATGEDLKVFLDGVDVTRNCFEADDIKGYVRLFCTDTVEHKRWDAQGAKHVRGGSVCRLEVRGRVEYRT